MSLAAPQLPPGFTLRAPWPDELPRLRSLLAASPSPHPVHLRALFHHAPERLMGGYAIARPAEGPDGILSLRLRPAWHGTPVHAALLASAQATALGLGLTTLHLVLPEDAPDLPAYLATGAKITKTEHFFEGDIATLARRLATPSPRLSARLDTLSIHPLAPADHEEVAALLDAHGLFNLERARRRLAHQSARDLAYVCRREGQLAGLVLALARPSARLYIEILAAAPAHRAASALIVARLLREITPSALAAGFRTFTLCCQPAKDHETLALARRLACRVLERRATLQWPLA